MNIVDLSGRGFVVVMVLFGLIFVTPQDSRAEVSPLDAPLEVVLYGENDTIRGFVGRHLQDPDLWPLVLLINDIASPADLVPGIALRLPVRQVMAADDALNVSLAAIQRATAEGASIFAPTEIGSAIENRNSAILRREEGEWRQVVSYAGIATDFANQALEISIAQRDRSAEAIVSDVHGSVEGRAPAEPRWSDRGLNDILVEFERLRTLSGSTTQITFRDLSRLRLNPNSNAIIQRMRSDPLTGGEVTKVSLVNGDFYALLNQLSEKTSFEIEVPGIETKTNSADFWIKSDQTGARFVNYDAPELEINRGSDKISIGENEGVVLTDKSAERARILTSPRLTTPELGEIIFVATTSMNWEAFEGAEAYWLEVATDPGFNKMHISEWGVRGTVFEAQNLPPARYHWRVAALDRLGLPGEWSTAQDFTVRNDQTPPYLTLLSPAADSILTKPTVEILGASEIEVALLLNGAAIDIGSDGAFTGIVDLQVGQNTISVVATDPAGNQSQRSLNVIYRPAAQVDILLDPDIPRIDGVLATRNEQLSVSGKSTATPGAAVIIRGANGARIVQTLVEPQGGLSFTVPVADAPRRYLIEILAPGGEIEGREEFSAMRDRVPPEVTLDLPPPRATRNPVVSISGQADDAVELALNRVVMPLTDGRFDLKLSLVPGFNEFELVAIDVTGNISLTQLQTQLDLDPPQIRRVDLGRPQGASGTIELVVAVTDESGLRQAAPFVISIDGVEREGFMRCDSERGICRASLPPEPGALELIELIVEDYAGNTAFN